MATKKKTATIGSRPEPRPQNYEHIFIARQDLSVGQVEEIRDAMLKLVTDAKGKTGRQEYWGLRTLAYEIKKNRKGHYMLMNFETTGEVVSEIERQLRLNEDILRYMTVVDELNEDGPSVMARNDNEEDSRSSDRRPSSDRSSSRDDRPARGAA